MESKDIYVEFGDDSPEDINLKLQEISLELHERIEKANKAGL